MRRTVESKLRWLKREIEDCHDRPLGDACRGVVFGEGDPSSSLVIVGEGPGVREEAEGRPFVGRAGDILGRLLASVDLPRDDLWITNVLKRRAVRLRDGRVRNRRPTANEVAVHKKYLERELLIISPRIVLCLGSVAASALIHPNFEMTRERGVWFTSEEGRKLMATFHPAYLGRFGIGSGKEVPKQALKDFAAVAEAYRAARPLR